MKTKIFLSMAAVVSAFAFSSCSDDKPGAKDTPRRDIEVSRSEQQVLNAQQTFAFDLFNRQLKSTQENVVYSPFSVSAVLSMTANGTEGDMQREILNTLHFESSADVATMNNAANRLFTELPTLDNRTVFTSAQSVWTMNHLTLLDEFRRACADSYLSSFGSYASQDEGASAINNWVSNHTNGMIKKAVKPADVGSIMIANATYFKGLWLDPFKKDQTKRLTFTNADSSNPTVDMMSGTKANYLYWEDNDLQMVRLPYGNGSFAMYVVLPVENKQLSDVFSGLNQTQWSSLKSKMAGCEVRLQMPRFEMESTADLKDILVALGVKKLWNEHTSGIADTEIMMEKLIHSVKIVVDEEGTEAASSSVISGWDSFVTPGNTVEMKCNRPFAFVIEEQSTGAILFIGAVNKL